MFRNAHFFVLLPLLFYACVNGAALAQSSLQPASQNGVTYVTGGVGQDEVQAFRAAAPGYNLRMTFASRTGSYLSDVDVTIHSGAGRPVLVVRTAGPFLLVRLPAGSYQIKAKIRHITENRKVDVPARGGIDVRFYWEDPDSHGVVRLCKSCPDTNRL